MQFIYLFFHNLFQNLLRKYYIYIDHCHLYHYTIMAIYHFTLYKKNWDFFFFWLLGLLERYFELFISQVAYIKTIRIFVVVLFLSWNKQFNIGMSYWVLVSLFFCFSEWVLICPSMNRIHMRAMSILIVYHKVTSSKVKSSLILSIYEEQENTFKI